MKKVFIVRVSEIFLKGKNRPFFQRILLKNINSALSENNISYDLVNKNNRILIYSDDDCSCIKNVFGISNYSEAFEVDSDIDVICDSVKSLWNGGSYFIISKRLDKSFPIKSPDMNVKIANFLAGTADFNNPDETFYVEVDKKSSFVFTKKIECFGGLPLGSEGKVGVLIQDNCLRSAWLVMRRGCDVVFFGGEIDVSPLKRFASGHELNVQESIPDDISAVVVSDTLESLNDYDFSVPVFRPLIGFDLKELDFIFS